MLYRILAIFLIAQGLYGQVAFKEYTQKINGSTVSFTMMPIQAGPFKIGSNSTCEGGAERDETPQKTVKISDFWMGKHEVTYDEYQLFFEEEKDPAPKPDGITRPSPPYIDFTLGMGKTGGYPANSMQQYAALMYCKWLYKKTGIFYRLPTELEWEYAAKMGAPADFNDTKDTASILKYAHCAANSGGKYQKVGLTKSNIFGLYDMYGNVAEWTMDQYDTAYYAKIAEGAVDPMNAKTKRHPTAVRGGHYDSHYRDIRPTNRTMSDPLWNRRDPQIPKSKWWNADSPFVGFRVVRPFKQPSKVEIEKFFETHLK